MNFQEFYIRMAQGSVLIPIIAGIYNYKVLTKPFKILLYFCMASVLFEIQSEIVIAKFQNNMPGQHLFTLLEFLMFTAVFCLMTQKNSLLQRLMIINAFVSSIVAIIDVLHNGPLVPNDLSRGYSSVFLTIYALGYLYHLFTSDSIQYVWEYPMFWVCISMLIYFTLNTLYFMQRSTLVKEYVNLEWINYLFQATLIIIANFLVAQSFICQRKYKTTSRYPSI